jgi:Rne/Rng family ribonuclease
MSKELIVSSTAHETKVAILEDDELVEIYFEREKQFGLAGSIYKGRVTRVLPGMQSAFVNVGLDRDAFLYVSDFFEDNEEYDRIVTTVEDKVVKMEEKKEALAQAALGEARQEPENGGPAAQEPESSTYEVRSEKHPSSAQAAAPNGHTGAPALFGSGHRGRRGRRRRMGSGRGFPETKFIQPAEVATEAAEASPGPEVTFEVLPGESLAKYRQAAESAGLEAKQDSEQQGLSAQHEGDMDAPSHHLLAREALAEDSRESMDSKAAYHALAAESPSENGRFSGEQEAAPLPRAVLGAPHGAASEAIAGTAREPCRDEEVIPPQVGLSDEAAPEPDAGEESFSPSESTLEREVLESEHGRQEGLESVGVYSSLSQKDASGSLEEISAEQVGAEALQTGGVAEGLAGPRPEAAGEAAAAPEAIVEGASEREASVREKPYGQRYLHRGSRRMRRRGREFRDRRGAERSAETSQAPTAEAKLATPRTAETSITDLLKEGQEIIVQIAKEPIGKKGARITSHIALPGRYLVYMPTVDHVGVSRKIVSDEERLRLKRIVQTHRVGMPGGFIVRTAGEGQPEEEIRSDMHFLYNLWLDLRQKAERTPAPALIHHDLNLVERLLRDQLTDTFKTIWVDTQEDYERILQFVERFQPNLVGRVKLYTRSTPIFDEFGITPELEKALRPKVWLKSGGYIVINQTEALVAIDVNTGKYVGKSNRLEDTIVKTNMDAVKEIVRQIRLRDLGGIIVVDFIDMDERKNRQKVMQALDEALRADRSPSKILQFNDFGLVAITRKRVKQSLERTLCSPCPYCDGSGYVKSPATVIQEILAEAKKIAPGLDQGNVTLRVNQEVAKVLKSRDNSYLEELETILRRPVLVKGDPLLHQEKFDFN